jgi:hypothetical protein
VNGLDNNRFGGGITGTFLHPAVAVATVLACILILLVRRKYMIVPFLVFVIFAPMGQEWYVAGLHLFMTRVVILAGLVRMAAAKKTDGGVLPGGFNPIDKMFVVCTSAAIIATILLFMQMGAVVNQLGTIWDAFGGYFLIRFMIPDEDGVARFIKTLGVCEAIVAMTMLSETVLHQNLFGFITGDSGVTYREGAIRAHGPFFGPIVAGTFGATSLCLFFWLWKTGKARSYALLGIFGSTLMTGLSESSTPLLAYLACLIGLSFWPLRKQMRMVRWGIVAMLISLQMVMKSPVWFRIDLIAPKSSMI